MISCSHKPYFLNSYRRLSHISRGIEDIPHLKEWMRKIESKYAPLPKKKTIHYFPKQLRFHIETYGCKMNTSDSEIIRSILLEDGHREVLVESNDDLISADLIIGKDLLNPLRSSIDRNLQQILAQLERMQNQKSLID